MKELKNAIPDNWIAYIRECGEAAIRNKIMSCEGYTHPRKHKDKYIGIKFGWVEGRCGPIPQRFSVHVTGRYNDMRRNDEIDERYEIRFEPGGYDVYLQPNEDLTGKQKPEKESSDV